MKKHLFSLALLFLATAAGAQEENLTQYVDPTIGTGDHGHVFVGTNIPFGMVNAGPTQIETGWDWCSGYHQSGDSIVGFAQLHLSGTGCSDLGDIALMPTTGPVELSRQGLASPFSHDTEEVRPGYYRVALDRGHILCELTSTNRVAMHKYTWPRGTDDARIIIDLENAVGDRLRQARLVCVDDHTITGYRISYGWANEQHIYFTIRFSHPIKRWLCDSENAPYGQAVFEVGPGESVMAKVALSPTSEMNAYENLCTEMPTWDFKAIRQQADEAWNRELSRVKASFVSDKQRTIFYTALYHLMVAPQTWNDITGDYRGSDGRIYRNAPFTNYTTWSLWDTYRAAHPLQTILFPERMNDYAQTMLHIYREQGELPVWHLMSNETYCMVGCPGVSVLADICMKLPAEKRTFDINEAYEAMKTSLLKDNRSLHWMKELGYIPYNHGDIESVAKTLEYYIADWSAAQVAGMVGNAKDSTYFAQRSQGYKKLFDPRVQCMRPLDEKGQFKPLTDFNPCYQTPEYTEGNPWQYTWLVPHDVKGLVSCFPSEKAFCERLDSLFLADSQLNENANPDITGLIGQYAHGNEPSHHVLYLYNYVNQPRKTQKLVRRVMDELYTDQPAGLCGNEDVGQMSAWYILSALGLYQVEPCGGNYQLGSPVVREATLQVGEGKTFTIRTHNNSEKAIYVKKVLLNGKPLKQMNIQYADIMQGGTLEFFMSEK